MENNLKINFAGSILYITGNFLIMKPGCGGVIDDIISNITCKYEKNKEVYKNPIHLLFIRIIEDMQLNMNSLINTNEIIDGFKYSDIKRNCRSIIEAYIDMLNLHFNPDYIEIIKLNCKCNDLNEEKINKILEPVNRKIKIVNNIVPNDFININKKIDILNQYDILDEEEKEFYKGKLIKYLNKYSHPNIFMQNIDKIANINSIQTTLHIAMECLYRAFIMIIANILEDIGLKKEIESYVKELDKLIEICKSNLDKWIIFEKHLIQF